MSELPENRKRVYDEVGLTAEADDYPDITTSDPSLASEVRWATANSINLLKFFKTMEKDPELAGIYEGYAGCLQALVNRVGKVVRATEPTTVSLSVKPGKYKPTPMGQGSAEGVKLRRMALDPEKLYEGEETAASQALRLLAYKMIRAEEIAADIDSQTGYGHVVLGADVSDKRVYFIERYDHDEQGSFMSWDLTNTFPTELAGAKPSRTFLTTSQEEALMEEFETTQTEITEIPTTEVDEAALVRAYWTEHRST